MVQEGGHRRGGKYDTAMYYKRPEKGWHPGWIVTGSRSSLETFMIRGFTPLWDFGTIPAPTEGEPWNEWMHILRHPKGPGMFPAEQVLTLRWYKPEDNPLPGTKWPQLQGHKVTHFPCPECEREFVMIDGAGGPIHLASHLNMIHKWDRQSLTIYGDRVGINFNESFSSLKKAYDFGVEDGLADVGCDECDYVPAAGKSAEKAVRMHSYRRTSRFRWRRLYQRKYPDLKVYIGSSIWRTVEPMHMKALMPLLYDPRRYGYFPQTGDALMERTRGISATYFLRMHEFEKQAPKPDVWLCLDSDIVQFEKDAIDELVEQAVDHDIVAGVYICKSISRTFPASAFLDNTTIEFSNDPGPVEIQWAATGCLAVHRRVFEAMAETMPLLHEADGPRAFYPFFQTMIHEEPERGPILLSEDFAFSERAKQLGFKIYANPRVRMGHMGPFIYRLEDMAQEVFEPQPLKLSRSGPYWRIEMEGKRETPESQGRLRPGQKAEVEQRFGILNPPNRAERRRNQKALTAAKAAD